MFDLVQHTKNYSGRDGSANIDVMLQNNIDRRVRSEELEIEILTLAGQMNAVQYRFIKLLVEFDENGGWRGDGIHSFAHWLNWKIGLGMMMGREKVRVARSLADLPLIDQAFSEGKVSYSKVRAMTRVATPENEQFLLQIAEYGTANHMEFLVRKYQYCKRLQEPRESENWKRYKDLGWYQDETGMIVINVRLPPEEGALVIRALEIIQAENRRKKEEVEEKAKEKEETTGVVADVDETNNEQSSNNEIEVKVDSNNVSEETFSQGMSSDDFLADKASALVHMAESFLLTSNIKESGNSLGEKYQVFLHINANAASIDCKVSQSDNCTIDNKRFLTPEVAKRLACDASISTVLEDDQGNVLNIGRRSRIVPRVMSHALRIRDGGCRFPGCCQNHYTDAHHIKHWAEGGETSMENLVTLCQLCRARHKLHYADSNIMPRQFVTP